jgi:T5SS/PEP-CTERM-associated repeat protein
MKMDRNGSSARRAGKTGRIKAGVPKRILAVMLVLMAAGFMWVSGAGAAITTAGDVTPTDPSTWKSGSSGTSAYIGNTSDGSLSIDGGSVVSSRSGYLGAGVGKNGIVTVSGDGSSWTNSWYLYVGQYGGGTLNIINGGTVTAGYAGAIGRYAGSAGIVNVDGNSSWQLGSSSGATSLMVGYAGTGELNITNGGKVTSNRTDFSVGYSATGNGLVTVGGAGSTLDAGNYAFTVANSGVGTLKITGGASVTNASTTYIGKNAGSTGTVIVDGVASMWSGNAKAYIGYSGTGSLTITGGGVFTNNTDAIIGCNSGSSGKVTVDGVASTWNVGYSLSVGASGTGKLSISNGGSLTASSVSVNSSSSLTTDVGSFLTVGSGTGTITNNGTIRLVAGAGTAAGTYIPLSYGTLTGNTPQALGGVWNDANHTVTVNAAATAAAGAATTFDLASTQRVLITDAATGQSVGAAFQAATAPTNLTITATAIADLAGLKGQLASGTAVLSAWDFTITQGYTSGSPVYLSLFAGSNQSLSTLSIWHYDGSTWSAFTANDLAYDGTYASFTATGFSGYAVSGTAPVPIPAAVWLLGSGLAGLVGMRRRLFRK